MATANRKIYRIKLTAEEREDLRLLVRKGRAAGWKIQRAQCLLKVDESDAGPGWVDQRTAEAFDVTTRSLESWRKQAVANGPMSLLERKAQDKSKQRKLDGAGEARLCQIACSEPPEGRSRWTLKLLADELVALEVVDAIGLTAVGNTLKKTRSSLGGRRCGARPRRLQPLS